LNCEGLAKAARFRHHEGMPKPKAKKQSQRNPTAPNLLARAEGKLGIGPPIAPKKPLNKARRTRKAKP
jgi:hypothetical protein